MSVEETKKFYQPFIDYLTANGITIATSAVISQYILNNWGKIPIMKGISNNYVKHMISDSLSYFMATYIYGVYVTTFPKA